VSNVQHPSLATRDHSSEINGHRGGRAEVIVTNGSDSEESEYDHPGPEGAPNTPWSLEQPDAVVMDSEISIDLDHQRQISDLGGLTNGGGIGAHLMQSAPHDMLYLASLWDPSFNNPVLEPLSNGLVGGLQGNNIQSPENRFHLVNPEHASAYAELRDSRRRLGQQTSATNAGDNYTEDPHSLDDPDHGSTVQYLGLSGDLDPYLLHSMQFSDDGICDFRDFQYRRLAGRATLTRGQRDQTAEQMPVHFVVSKPNPGESESEAPSVNSDPATNLGELVSPETGSRLVGLLVARTLYCPV
jgi:hypothetical protein